MGMIWKAKKRGTCWECQRPIEVGQLIWSSRSAMRDVTSYSHLICDAEKKGVTCESGKSEVPQAPESL